MSVIIIDPEVEQQLRKLKANALTRRFSIQQIKEFIANKRSPVGDDPAFVVCLPGTGCRFVLSVEEQPVGWCWHVSISVAHKAKVPAPALTAQILKLLDIDPADTVTSWPENLRSGGTAINMLVLDHNLDPERN